MLACDSNGETYFYIQNIRGDVMMLVKGDGTVGSIRDYDASGQMLCKAPREDRDPFGFTGGLDAGNGLWKLGARFYDSSKNSFIQQDRYMGDPKDPLSLKRYVYCGIDPVNYVDPTGFYAEVTADGNNITIEVPIIFTGSNATKDNIAELIKFIQDTWSGKFGKYLEEAGSKPGTTERLKDCALNPRTNYLAFEIVIC